MEKCMSKFCGYPVKDKTARQTAETLENTKLSIYAGAENINKMLVVGDDGYITFAEIPEPEIPEPVIPEPVIVFDGFSENGNNRISDGRYIISESSHGYSNHINKKIVAIKLNVAQPGRLTIGSVKTPDYEIDYPGEEEEKIRITLDISEPGVQTIELPDPLIVRSGEDLFIGTDFRFDTAKYYYGNTEKSGSFLYDDTGVYVSDEVSINITLYAIDI